MTITKSETMSEVFLRMRKASRIETAVNADPRKLTPKGWLTASQAAGVRAPSAATRAAVIALRDVKRENWRDAYGISQDERKAYFTARKAALIAEVLADAEIVGEPKFHQWAMAARIANAKTDVKDPSGASEVVRDAVRAIRSMEG